MKILKIRVEGLPRYSVPFEVSLYAAQRVESSHQEAVFKLCDGLYINTAVAFAGINASGKTTALRIIAFCGLLLSGSPLNPRGQSFAFLADNTQTVFDIDFYTDNALYHLQCTLLHMKETDGSEYTQIVSETLQRKELTSKITKKNFLDFTGIAPVRIRENNAEYLPDDVSIMIAVNRKIEKKNIFVNLLEMTNINLFLPIDGEIPTTILSLLDPTIERITVKRIQGKFLAKLKFLHQDEISIYSPSELNIYLSSGTVKGIQVYQRAIQVLQSGGYLLIDEIENHFNKELVAALLRLFMDKRTNPNGSVILFSTHYPELLDELVRNDSVYITRSIDGLAIDNLNTLVKRNDIKRSEIYESNFLGGTAPKYKALLALKKSIIQCMEDLHEG